MRVVVAEGLYLLRDGLVRLLEAHGFEIAAAVGEAPTLLRALLDERPPEFDDAAEAAPVVAEHESPREVEERLRSLGYLE